MALELVIFDCDGVLADGELLALGVLVEGARKAGAEIDAAEARRRFLGRSVPAALEILRRDFGVVFDEAALEAMRDELFGLLRRDLKPMPGVREALAGLAFPRCVASSSAPDRLALTLEMTGLAGFFPKAFSASMVERGKPAPDLFLKAAAEMGAAPARCLVIEDSPAGLIAARRAGMSAAAFVGGAHAQGPEHRAAVAALSPDWIFDEMKDLAQILARAEERLRRTP